MKRTTVASIVFAMFLGVASAALAAEPQSKPSDDYAVQIRAAQAERIKTLSRLIEILESQYKTGQADIVAVFVAEDELCEACLDAADQPEERISLLKKHVDRTNNVLSITQARFDAGRAPESDVLRAKSACLAAKIKLLRECNKKTQAKG